MEDRKRRGSPSVRPRVPIVAGVPGGREMTSNPRAPGHHRAPAERLGRTTRSSSALLSAGHILMVGLICFSIWTLLDARQLYQSANASPLGVRRDVAMSILRPIARVEELLSFDRVIDGADRVIGKSGSPGGSAITPVTTRPSTTPSRVVGKGGHTKTTTPATMPGPTALAQPTPAHPITILQIGDSLGLDLGIGLANELGPSKSVHFIPGAVGDTGLANLGYYSWIAQLPVDLKKYHPKVVMIMLGGNDAQPFQSGNTIVQPDTALWFKVYAARVAALITEVTSTNAQLIWVGLPIMGPTSGVPNVDIQAQNTVYAAQCKTHVGATFISTWKLFENAAGQYSTYLTLPGSGLVQVRDPDEVHVDPPGGTNLLGAYVIAQTEAALHIRI